MSASVLLLVLASAFVHAAWNALLKRERDTEGAAVAYLAVCTVVSVVAACLWPGRAFASGRAIAWALAAGVCEGVYFVALALAMARAPLGLVYTISRGGALVLVWPVSALCLGEVVNAARLGGTALVALGLVATGWPGARASDPATARRTGAGTTWALVAALAIAGYHLAYKLALAAGGAPAAVFALSLAAVALPMNLARLPDRGRAVRAFRARPATMLLAGTLSAASFLSILAALVAGGAGLVLTLRNTSVVFAQGMALLLGERPRRVQLAGVLLVAAGAVLLGWP